MKQHIRADTAGHESSLGDDNWDNVGEDRRHEEPKRPSLNIADFI